mgnify:CR=1 FL=1
MWHRLISGRATPLGVKSMMRFVLFRMVCLLASLSAFAVPHHVGNRSLDTVRLKFAAFDRHDVATIRSLYAHDAVLHSPDHSRLTGNGPIAETYRGLFVMIPDAKDVITSLDVSGNKVFSQYILTGHFQGAAGKPIKVSIMSVYTIRNNHIVLDDTY